jgi:hypothetical protein
MSKFKVGDIVEYYKIPTERNWIGIGEVDIPFKIGSILTVYGVSSKTGSLQFGNAGSYCYPKEGFRLVEKREPQFIFDI